jgi:periplasmic divalent cation tolerance protein
MTLTKILKSDSIQEEKTMSDTKYTVVITTTANREDAEIVARSLLEQKLAACVQLLPIHSFYMWEGAAKSENEVLLFIKTRANIYHEVEEAIVKVHKYKTPEIIQLPIVTGLPAYLSWISDETAHRGT